VVLLISSKRVLPPSVSGIPVAEEFAGTSSSLIGGVFLTFPKMAFSVILLFVHRIGVIEEKIFRVTVRVVTVIFPSDFAELLASGDHSTTTRALGFLGLRHYDFDDCHCHF
jgi:hypothetical protein